MCKSDVIVLIMKEVVVRKSHVFELPMMETRGESSRERRWKEIHAVVCAEMNLDNFVG